MCNCRLLCYRVRYGRAPVPPPQTHTPRCDWHLEQAGPIHTENSPSCFFVGWHPSNRSAGPKNIEGYIRTHGSGFSDRWLGLRPYPPSCSCFNLVVLRHEAERENVPTSRQPDEHHSMGETPHSKKSMHYTYAQLLRQVVFAELDIFSAPGGSFCEKEPTAVYRQTGDFTFGVVSSFLPLQRAAAAATLRSLNRSRAGWSLPCDEKNTSTAQRLVRPPIRPSLRRQATIEPTRAVYHHTERRHPRDQGGAKKTRATNAG